MSLSASRRWLWGPGRHLCSCQPPSPTCGTGPRRDPSWCRGPARPETRVRSERTVGRAHSGDQCTVGPAVRDQRTVGPAVRLSSRDRAHGASAPGPSLAGVRTWREWHEQGRQCRPAHCRVLRRTQVQLAGEGPRPPSRADGVSAPVAGRRASSVGQSPGQGVAWPLIPVWLLCRLLPAGQISQGVPCWGTGRPLP